MADIEGTSGADRLDAENDGDRVFGRGGADDLRSTYNNTLLSGGFDRDVLLTEINLGPTSALARQSGGASADAMTATIYLNSLVASRARLVLDGGDGGDRILASTTADADAVASISGGDGSDRIETEAEIWGDGLRGSARNLVDGGNGDDWIIARALHEMYYAAAPLCGNVVAGGNGDDRIRATAWAGYHTGEGEAAASNDVSGGLGDDVIFAGIRANSNGDVTLESVASGGDGNDRINLRTRLEFNGSNVVRHEADCGVGNDVVNSTISMEDLKPEVEARSRIDGGAGDDRLQSTMSFAEPADVFDARSRIDGGAGDDTVQSIISLNYYIPDVTTFSNRVVGGTGADFIAAAIVMYNPEMTGSEVIRFSNRVEGGAGGDEIQAAVTEVGRSVAFGGGGDDIITVFDGIDNLLDGGAGDDRLIGGEGDDNLVGGSGVDDFAFIPTENQGGDTIRDFDFDADRLVFFGVEDLGDPGAADDLALLIDEVDDFGLGDDVDIVFTSGTVITFEGAGTGAVDSIDDLVDRPRAQLVLEEFGPL